MRKKIYKSVIMGVMFSVSTMFFSSGLCNITESTPLRHSYKTVIYNDLVEDIFQDIKDKTELNETDFENIETSSEISVKTSVDKKTKKINVYPEDEYKIFYTKDLKLSDIVLPNGWEWENKDTTLDVGEGTYKALYITNNQFTYIGETEKEVKVIIDKSVYKVSGIIITVNEGTILTNDVLPSLEEGVLEWVTQNETVNENCIKVCKFTPYDVLHYNTIDNIDVMINVIPTVKEEEKDNNTSQDTSDSNTTDNTTDNTPSNTDSENKPQDIQIGMSDDTSSDTQSNKDDLGVDTSVRLDNEFQLPTITLGLNEDIDINDNNLNNNEIVDIQVTTPDYTDETSIRDDDTSEENTALEEASTEEDNITKKDNSKEKEDDGIDLFGIIAILGVVGIGGYSFVKKLKTGNTTRR